MHGYSCGTLQLPRRASSYAKTTFELSIIGKYLHTLVVTVSNQYLSICRCRYPLKICEFPFISSFGTHSEDQVVFDGVLFSLPGAVHAGGPLDSLLLHMAAARGLHSPLHALGGGGHIRRADHLQLERAAADVLVVEPQRQREVALLLHGVQELVRAVLVVQDLPIGHAAVGRAQLRREVGVARFAQLAVFVLGCYGNRHGLPDDGLPQPLARRHRLGGDGIGGQNRPEVVDGLLEPLGLHDEVQLVVFSRVQREI